MTRTMGRAVGVAKYGSDWESIYFLRKRGSKNMIQQE